MKATSLSPAEIFGNQIRYVVPLYQRPYVWTQEAQWQPLWDDVEALADRVLETPDTYGTPPVPPHFLGAVVIDQLPGPVSHIQTRSVIDGQQRLTTLQLLLDAAHSVVKMHGRAVDASALRVVVANDSNLAVDPDQTYKVWPTDRDQEAYRASMLATGKPTGDLARATISRAHEFFSKAVLEWSQSTGKSAEAGARLAALTTALRDKLRIVVIDLEPGDNAQVIFETLNHRGSPLLAADLIKNLMFQLAAAQGLDVEKLYATYWRDLDADYWRQQIARGRRFQPRIDVFMNRWLVMNLKREVPADRVFTEFRDNIARRPNVDIASLFEAIAADAQVHRSWETLPPSSVAGRFDYRVLHALDTHVVAPVFLWLTRYDDSRMPRAQQEKALGAIESWLVRRALVRATTKDYNNAMIDLLRALERDGPERAGDSAETFLAGQSAETRYWPNDARVADAVTTDRLYKTMTRPRLRMVLEALEDETRGSLGEGQSAPRGLTIEHVMPVAWREHWGADVAHDVAAGQRRDERIHRLGNLSLVNGKLNPTLSNRPWTDAEASARGLGPKGKRDYLLQHSQLKLNAELVYEHPGQWSDDEIAARTSLLLGRLLEIWPCPQDARQSDPIAAPRPPDIVTSNDEPWGVDEKSVQAAARLWLALDTTSQTLFRVLLDLAPERVAGRDLAQLLDLDSGVSGVADILGWPSRIAASLGRPLPISSDDSEASSYWIDVTVATTLEAGVELARVRALNPPRARRSVPAHIHEVFSAKPPTAELTVREVAREQTADYQADEISQGAISAAMNSGRVEGIEWVPGSSPRRIRRRG